MIITVTQKNIDQGKRGLTNLCPVALACLDAGLHNPSVRDYVVVWKTGMTPSAHVLSSYLPEDVARRIAVFDEHGTMDPFSFSLEVA